MQGHEQENAINTAHVKLKQKTIEYCRIYTSNSVRHSF